MKVGGRDFLKRRVDVEAAMRGVEPESIQKYAIKVNGKSYPPKQVLATVTGWERTTFTTMEAQRVLGKLGFESFSGEALRAAQRDSVSQAAMELTREGDTLRRLAAIESALVTAQEAIAGLAARVRVLEAPPATGRR